MININYQKILSPQVELTKKSFSPDEAANKIKRSFLNFLRYRSSKALERANLREVNGPILVGNKQLSNYYNRKNSMGDGSQGQVIRVHNKQLNIDTALKISYISVEEKLCVGFLGVAELINQALDNQTTPHLARVLNVWKLKSNKNHFSSSVETFIDEMDKTPQRLVIATEMDLLGDNLTKCKLSPFELMASKVQNCATIELLHNLYGLEIRDNNLRNICIKQLSAEDSFRGKRYLDFDFWKYQIGNHTFYVPKMSFIIKLIDFDMWSFNSNFIQFKDDKHSSFLSHFKMPYFNGFNETIEGEANLKKWAQLFPKPTDPNAKILDMT